MSDLLFIKRGKMRSVTGSVLALVGGIVLVLLATLALAGMDVSSEALMSVNLGLSDVQIMITAMILGILLLVAAFLMKSSDKTLIGAIMSLFVAVVMGVLGNGLVAIISAFSGAIGLSDILEIS